MEFYFWIQTLVVKWNKNNSGMLPDLQSTYLGLHGQDQVDHYNPKDAA